MAPITDRTLRHGWRPTPGRRGYTAAIVTVQVLAQTGAFALPALLPTYMARWHLSAADAGWLVGIFFAAYVVMVPVLLALTDRFPARRVYLLGLAMTTLSHLGFAFVAAGFWSGLLFRILAGIGWAGSYMPGLKILADPLEGTAQSRVVSWHALGIGVANAGSFAVAGLVAELSGSATAAFVLAAAAAAVAFIIAASVVTKAPSPHAKPSAHALFDFRPLWQNRPAMAWIAGYTVHTWEMAVLRAWGVTFFAATIAWNGAPRWLPSPTVLFTSAGLVGVVVSVLGNEMAQYFGRQRIVMAAMIASALLSMMTGWTAGISAPLAVVAVTLWTAAVYLDSSALTAGVIEAADRDKRGATMGLHSMCGYAGGFIGPPLAGFILDVAGHDRIVGWGLAFGYLGIVTLAGLAVLHQFAQPAQTPRRAQLAG